MLVGLVGCALLTDLNGLQRSDDCVGAACVDGAIGDANADALDASGGGDAIVDAGPDAAFVCNVTPCVVQLAAVGEYTCARLADGTARCWGANATGQLGTGSLPDGTFDSTSRVKPTDVGLTGIDEIAAGAYGRDQAQTCARIGTSVLCWGNDQNHQLGRPGSPFSNGAPINADAAPVQDLSTAAQLALGADISCALDTSSSVSCWGLNTQGQLGRGTTSTFELVPAPWSGSGAAKQVVAGREHACALLVDGTVTCWGDSNRGALGVLPFDGGLAQPTAVAGLADIAQLASTGANHTCALTTKGNVLCWGRNRFAQLGRASTTEFEATPASVTLPGPARYVAVGAEHACAILTDDSVVCWGRNTLEGQGDHSFAGQVGFPPAGGFDVVALTARPIHGLVGKPLSLALGYGHSCAVLEGGRAACWGSNRNGQLGRVTTADYDAGFGPLNSDPHPVAAPVEF
ncbi:MAG: hypothetical protein ABIP89_03735 [Polyangiaceae bacterium]